MPNKLQFDSQGSQFWTPSCGIVRWGFLTRRPGTYRVVALPETLDFIRLTSIQSGTWDHPTCVVDDFGTLRRVSE